MLTVLQFLDVTDGTRVCLVSPYLNKSVSEHDEVLFKAHVLDEQLVSLPTPVTLEQKVRAAQTLQTALALKGGWRGLSYVTRHVTGRPCLGYFRQIPRDFRSDFRGKLFRVRLEDTEVSDMAWAPEGPPRGREGRGLVLEEVTCSCTYEVVKALRLYRAPGQSGSCLGGVSDGEPLVKWTARVEPKGRGRSREDRAADTQVCFDVFHSRVGALHPLAPCLSLSASGGQLREFEDLQGLWSGVYGSHGWEIIQVRLRRLWTDGSAGTSPSIGGRVILEGLKLVGDANVPANEWTFRADVTAPPMDRAEALGADTRPIYSLTTRMVPQSWVLAEEAGRIRAVYRGKGQVNMVPGIWEPQEVGVDVTLLRREENGGREGIWLLWHDEGFSSRHCIELTRLMEGEDTGEGEGRAFVEGLEATSGSESD